MGHFLNRFTGKNQFLLHESESFYQSAQYPKMYPPSTLGSTSNHENCPFSVKTLGGKAEKIHARYPFLRGDTYQPPVLSVLYLQVRY